MEHRRVAYCYSGFVNGCLWSYPATYPNAKSSRRGYCAKSVKSAESALKASDDPQQEQIFRDLWEDETQREVVIDCLKADCEVRTRRPPGVFEGYAHGDRRRLSLCGGGTKDYSHQRGATRPRRGRRTGPLSARGASAPRPRGAPGRSVRSTSGRRASARGRAARSPRARPGCGAGRCGTSGTAWPAHAGRSWCARRTGHPAPAAAR